MSLAWFSAGVGCEGRPIARGWLAGWLAQGIRRYPEDPPALLMGAMMVGAQVPSWPGSLCSSTEGEGQLCAVGLVVAAVEDPLLPRSPFGAGRGGPRLGKRADTHSHTALCAPRQGQGGLSGSRWKLTGLDWTGLSGEARLPQSPAAG